MDDRTADPSGSSFVLLSPNDLSVRMPLPRAELITVWRAKDGTRVLSIVAGGKSQDFAMTPEIEVMLLSEAARDIIEG